MKHLISYISILLFLLSCDSKDAYDCVKKTGDILDYQVELSEAFDTIHIYSNVEVEIKQAPLQSVVLSTGKNLYDKMAIEVAEGVLTFRNDNSCNWAREYGTTKLQISTPDLKQIIYEGEATIKSVNTLVFDTLSIDSKDSSGDYILDIVSNELNVTTKRISNFYITGTVNDLNLDFQTGDGRFYGKGLIAQNVFFYQNGTNDIMVYPVQTLEGIIDRYGNVIYYNAPVNPPKVKTYSKGKLIGSY